MNEYLRNIRQSKKLSMRDVARLLNIHYHTYCNYEYGNAEPSHEILKKLSEIYKCSIDDLLGIKKDPPEEDEPMVSGEIVYQFLIDAGYIQDGEDLSDSDLRFLESVLDILSEWFAEKDRA